MSNSTAPANPAPGDLYHQMQDYLSQMKPFRVDSGTEEPTLLIKTSDFDQHWKANPDPNGSYIDEFGRRLAVRKRIDDENDFNDVHWAAHNAARFWLAIPILDGWNKDDLPLSIVWRMQIRAMRKICRENIQELAHQEMARMKAQADTRSTVATAPNPYPYPELLSEPSAIRLVVLLPAKERHASIVCVLCNSTLSKSDSDKYEALSYVWGDPSKRKPITVNGRQFQATKNLELALRDLRDRDNHRVLWIDSICINQNDVQERNKQVRQMDSIYKKAQNVVVWLGPESDTSSNAFNFFHYGYIKIHDSQDSQVPEPYRKAVRASVEAFHHLSKRTWFSRIWCIQEFLLGRRVDFQCGQHSISWEDISSTILVLENNGLTRSWVDVIKSGGVRLQQKYETALTSFLNLFYWKKEPSETLESVLSLLSDFRKWESSDPRDLMFAFYGLVAEQSPAKDFLKPDYSLSISQVYTKFAAQYLRAHRQLEILSVATHPMHNSDVSKEHYMPSWVPDWRDNNKFYTWNQYKPVAFFGTGTHIFRFDTLYDASFGLEATSLHFEENSQILSLEGIEVDTVEDIAVLHMGVGQSVEDARDVLSKWKAFAALSAEGYYRYTSQPIREAFWRTLLMDNYTDLSPSSKGPQRARIPPTDARIDGFAHFPPSAQDDVQCFEKATRQNCPMNGRRLFKTSRGFIGLAPASAQKGDSIVVLFGGKAPFIMRKFDEWHHLVGECYVHGIMHGEIIHQPRTEEFQDLKVQRFLLA